MPSPGEYTYFQQIGEAGRRHSIEKPFSDGDCAYILMDVGVIFDLLPKPPARILECGCGTGWLSYFLAKRGFDVTGQDCNMEAIELARNNPVFYSTSLPVRFICSDFQSLPTDEKFDAAIFYGALHHSDDPCDALKSVYNVLNPSGIVIAVEPGIGHERKSRSIRAEFGVGDKDMPPTRVHSAGRRAGFRTSRFYPHGGVLLNFLDKRKPQNSVIAWFWKFELVKIFSMFGYILFLKRYSGITVLQK